jgi:hypothetical protein
MLREFVPTMSRVDEEMSSSFDFDPCYSLYNQSAIVVDYLAVPQTRFDIQSHFLSFNICLGSEVWAVKWQPWMKRVPSGAAGYRELIRAS